MVAAASNKDAAILVVHDCAEMVEFLSMWVLCGLHSPPTETSCDRAFWQGEERYTCDPSKRSADPPA
jgi:hypothetical protein